MIEKQPVVQPHHRTLLSTCFALLKEDLSASGNSFQKISARDPSFMHRANASALLLSSFRLPHRKANSSPFKNPATLDPSNSPTVDRMLFMFVGKVEGMEEEDSFLGGKTDGFVFGWERGIFSLVKETMG